MSITIPLIAANGARSSVTIADPVILAAKAIAWSPVPAMGNNWTSGMWSFGGSLYWPETAQRPYDLQVSTNATTTTARFEVRPNELWSAAVGGNDTERSEGDGSAGKTYAVGQSYWCAYSLMLEPGAPQIATAGGYPGGPAAWFIVGQWHGTGTAAAVPAEMNLITTLDAGGGSHENLRFTVQTDPGQTVRTLWTDQQPFHRGRVYDIVVNLTIAGKATDRAQVWVNGAQVVNFTGVIGSASAPSATYFKFGIYRGWQGDGLPPVAAQYANVVQSLTPINPSARPAWPTIV